MTTMHAAVVSTFSKPPSYTTIPALTPPATSQLQLKVLATGLHNLVRSRASGKHYSSPPLPQIPGTDGVGVTSDGTRYYFSAFRSGGSLADYINDYVNCPLPMALLSSHKQTKPLQYVHIGTLSGEDMALPGAVLRSSNLTIRGSGPGAWTFAEAARETPALLEALAGVGEQKVRVVNLEDVEADWERKGAEGEGRVVFVP